MVYFYFPELQVQRQKTTQQLIMPMSIFVLIVYISILQDVEPIDSIFKTFHSGLTSTKEKTIML